MNLFDFFADNQLIFVISTIAVVFLLVIYFSVTYFVKLSKTLDDISAAKNFQMIDALRHTLSVAKWTEDIDIAEKGLITEIMNNIEMTKPVQIGTAYNRSLRYELDFRKNTEKQIISYLDKKIEELNKTDLNKLKELENLSNVVYHTASLKKIGSLKAKLNFGEKVELN